MKAIKKNKGKHSSPATGWPEEEIKEQTFDNTTERLVQSKQQTSRPDYNIYDFSKKKYDESEWDTQEKFKIKDEHL